MKILIFLLLVTVSWLNVSYSQRLEVVRFDKLEHALKNNKDSLLVVNFWATWCKPCVAELPYFEQLADTYKSNKVKVLLVSLDFPNEFDTKLRPFLKRRGIKSQVMALNETNPNTWINKINPDWSGAIPATMLVNPVGQYVQFAEHPFTYSELETFIKPFLPQ